MYQAPCMLAISPGPNTQPEDFIVFYFDPVEMMQNDGWKAAELFLSFFPHGYSACLFENHSELPCWHGIVSRVGDFPIVAGFFGPPPGWAK